MLISIAEKQDFAMTIDFSSLHLGIFLKLIPD